MQSANQLNAIEWQWWRKLLFCFCFIFLMFQIIYFWFSIIPGIDAVTSYYYSAEYNVAMWLNTHWFHFKLNTIYTDDNSSDPVGWAQQWTVVMVAFAGSIIWAVANRRRENYSKLNYWLCLFTRYYVASVAVFYGLDKVQLLQMPFPNQSQLATPLGDFSPMRLSWMFVGYSAPYQLFSGLMECLVAVLLFYRRTATLGVMLGTGVFANVVMINAGYDIKVIIFAINVLFACLFLLANEWDRIACFFFLNKPVSTCNLYQFSYERKSMRIARRVLKATVLIAIVFSYWKSLYVYDEKTVNPKPIRNGMYNVSVYAINRDTVPAMVADTMRWQDVVFEKNGSGSIKTADSAWHRRYNRAYFEYTTDTVAHTLELRKFAYDSLPVMTFRYTLPDSTTINLWGSKNNDSVYVQLVRSNRRFQLADRRFR